MTKNRIFSALLALLIIFSALASLSSCFGEDEDSKSYSLDDIPAYSGQAYVLINDNTPFFDDDEIYVRALEAYAPLDPLGRCGVAYACIGKETMPTEDREEIGSVTPSGWEYNKVSNNKRYDFVDGGYLYNRCHLIGFQLAGENANEKNLITGTRYLNIDGMLVFEDMIADYVKATNNHVLYRVTPIFESENLVASGVLMEGISIEDKGEGIKFCVYAFNVQPGVKIDYFTGQNVHTGEELPPANGGTAEDNYIYIINKKSKTVHLSVCGNASGILNANREEFEGELELLLEEYAGYKACGSCLPDLVIPAPKEDATDTPSTDNGEGGGTTDTPSTDNGEGGGTIDTPSTDNGEGEPVGEITFILNTNTKKYHLPTCKNTPSSEANRKEYYGTLEQLIEEYPNYTPCGSCKPNSSEE